jgi:membrane-associated phospholipid phosphatase
MDAILFAGIDLIHWLQSLGAWLTPMMAFFSFLGTEEFFLLVLPALYWCLDSRLGVRVGVILLVSNGLNTIFKLAFHLPRPFWYDPGVKALAAETSFGLPSAHAQNAVVLWGRLASGLKRGWITAAAIVFALLIGVSRLYLGVHFPSDVLVGWLFGGLLLFAFIRLEQPFLSWFSRRDLGGRILILLGTTLTILLVGALAILVLSTTWEFPAAWLQNAADDLGGESLNPLALEGLITTCASFFGLGLGALLMQAQGGFDPKDRPRRLLYRYLLGLLGAVILWQGLGLIFPRGENLLSYGLRFIRYSLVGFWITYLAPLMFIRLKLLEALPPAPMPPPAAPAPQASSPVVEKPAAAPVERPKTPPRKAGNKGRR